jgi:hypothetical protein
MLTARIGENELCAPTSQQTEPLQCGDKVENVKNRQVVRAEMD